MSPNTATRNAAAMCRNTIKNSAVVMFLSITVSNAAATFPKRIILAAANIVLNIHARDVADTSHATIKNPTVQLTALRNANLSVSQRAEPEIKAA